MSAYDEMYLSLAMTELGLMLDYAVYDMKIPAKEIMDLFISSPFAQRFEIGDTSTLAGKSGIELAMDITGNCSIRPQPVMNRSPEYWAGWALAYYQWLTALSFREILSFAPIEQVIDMYYKYHEMDVSHFADRMNEMRKEKISSSAAENG